MVFERRSWIKKKYSDPERNNFEVVFCNVDGELIFHETLKLTQHARGRLQIHGAFGDEENIFLHMNIFEDEQMVGIARFDYNGNYTSYSYPKSELRAKQNLITGNAASSFNRDLLGNFDKNPGCNWGLSVKFVLLGARQLSSDIILYGQMVYTVDDPTAPLPTHPDGRPKVAEARPKMDLHGELIFFTYSKDFELKHSYIQEMELTKVSCIINHLGSHENKVDFYVSVPATPVRSNFTLANSMYDHKNISHPGYKYDSFFSPLFIHFGNNVENRMVQDLLLFDPRNSVLSRKDLSSSFVAVGFEIDQEGKHLFNLRKIDL